jgi:hypothetical protein
METRRGASDCFVGIMVTNNVKEHVDGMLWSSNQGLVLTTKH